MNINTDAVVSFGGAVKASRDGTVAGYGVLFTSPADTDLQNEYFHRETNFDLIDRQSVSVLWNHGITGVLKRRQLARAHPFVDNTGVFVEARLDKNKADVAEGDGLNGFDFQFYAE
jgi:phage head maturation protease